MSKKKPDRNASLRKRPCESCGKYFTVPKSSIEMVRREVQDSANKSNYEIVAEHFPFCRMCAER